LIADQYVLEPRVSVVTGSITATIPEGTDSSTLDAPVTLSPRYSINLGLTERMPFSGVRAQVAFSPDSRHIVYAAQRNGAIQLYLRELDQLEPRFIAGTEGGRLPFFSTDGEWVGFMDSEGGVSKIPVRGGSPQTLAEGQQSRIGGSWSADGTILFTHDDDFSLHRVAATGGASRALTTVTPGILEGHSWPHALPGGETILFTVGRLNTTGNGRIALLTVESGEVRDLIQGGYNARYVPTGHIVFMRSEALWAVPFNLGRLEIVGPEIRVIQGIETDGVRGYAAYAFSNAGRLIYLPGGDTRSQTSRNLVWVDRDGREELLDAEPRAYGFPRLSPNGERLAVTISRDLWTYDLERGTQSRRTFTGRVGRSIWTPDGERLVYQSRGLWWIAADGTGQPERITTESRDLRPEAFSPDGALLVYREGFPSDLYALSMDGERTEQPLIVTEFHEGYSAISPDGRWLAYTSDETGQLEVYVRPFPNVNDGKWPISMDGGEEPLWGPDGHEIFYRRATDNAVLVVSVEAEPSFTVGRPEVLFTGDFLGFGLSLPRPDYDVSPDGQRFLMLKDALVGIEAELPESQQTLLVVVDNWFEELNRLAPPSP